MVFRLVQASDTHVSARHAHFADDVAIVGHGIATAGADLAVVTGDLCMNGAGEPADLAAARSWLAGLGAPCLCVPGNHDVGDTPTIRPDQTIDDARLAAWRDHFGADRWIRDVEDWRLIGLDAMLFDSAHAEEEAQYAFLADAARTDRRLALFLHKPLFIERIDEPARGYWTVLPGPRARLIEALGDADLGLVASGHLHIAAERRIDGVVHFWAPSASFVCGPIQEDLGGSRFVGYGEHLFDGRTVRSRFVRPQGVGDREIDPVHDEIYPPSTKPAAAADRLDRASRAAS
jgi:3',5'-cyclic AMP phosphodiesterase CpdA